MGYFKGALVSRSGFYPTGDVFRQFGYDLGESTLPEAVAHWLASEKELDGRFGQEGERR